MNGTNGRRGSSGREELGGVFGDEPSGRWMGLETRAREQQKKRKKKKPSVRRQASVWSSPSFLSPLYSPTRQVICQLRDGPGKRNKNTKVPNLRFYSRQGKKKKISGSDGSSFGLDLEGFWPVLPAFSRSRYFGGLRVALLRWNARDMYTLTPKEVR